ncbi:MAG: AIR carboxylase family protein, partial [Dehalococcoidales bacterium]|nr:AIR carboxylase family protein [Dehalococcoidales bacterium]
MLLVGVVIGSQSDAEVIQSTLEVLTDLGIEHELSVLSAHRNPDKVKAYAESARDRGIEVIIAAAGMAAALPGVIASLTTLPV